MRAGVAASLAYLASGVTRDRARAGRACSSGSGGIQPPLLGPGLHVRLPAADASGDEGRARPGARRAGRPGGRVGGRARTGGLERDARRAARRVGPLLHRRREPRRAGRRGRVPTDRGRASPTWSSAWRRVERERRARRPRGSSARRSAGRRSKTILVAGRRGFEADVEARLRDRLARDGPERRGRPRPGRRRPPAARGRAGLPRRRRRPSPTPSRYRNEAEAYAAEQHWSALRRGAGQARRGRRARRIASRAAPRATARRSSPAPRPTPRGPT